MRFTSLIFVSFAIFGMFPVVSAGWKDTWNRIWRNMIGDHQYCIDETGKPVEWWIMYKMPKVKTAKSPYNQGLGYLYTDSVRIHDSAFRPGRYSLNDSKNPVARTLANVYAGKTNETFVMYNDDPVGPKTASASRAHAKGVYVFDNTTGEYGAWILSSIPDFPQIPKSTGRTRWKYEAAPQYGQTMLCISLGSNKELSQVAKYLKVVVPQGYATNIKRTTVAKNMKKLGTKGENLADAITVAMESANSAKWKAAYGSTPRQWTGSVKSGETFKLFARRGTELIHLWDDMVGPALKKPLVVETWRPSLSMKNNCKNKKYYIQNVVEMNHPGIALTWKYTKDHAKWAMTQKKGWVCIGDVNRQTSQNKRGGGCACVNDSKIWVAFNSMVTEFDKCK